MSSITCLVLFIAICVTCEVHGNIKPKTIPGQYLVNYKTDASDEEVQQHVSTTLALFRKLGCGYSCKVLNEFKIGKLRIKHYQLLDEFAHVLKTSDVVEDVEPNYVYHTSVPSGKLYYESGSNSAMCSEQANAPWGLERTTERTPQYYGIYEYNTQGNGEGVDVYILDTGVRLTHSEFEGNRVHFGTDVVDDPPVKDDLQGHGTHVTGTILGKNYGLAKGAEGYSVRVLDRDGYGSTSTVIAGIQWVENHHNSKANKKSVANLSLGGTKSTIFNKVIDEAVEAGILFVVAAGNEQADSCSTSPSSARYAISVGCTDQDDVFCSFSNYGDCVNILGPGMSIISASNQGDNLLAISSGTSMSAPHVAGVLAKYLSQVTGPLTYKDANDWLSKEATSNKITKLKAKTPNKLVFMDCAVGGDVKKLSRPAKLQKYYTPRAFYDQM